MKLFRYGLLVICISFIFVSDVLASEFNISLTGSDIIENKITVELEIIDVGDYDAFYGIVANLVYDDSKLDLSSINKLNGFDLTYNAQAKKLVLYSPNGVGSKSSVLAMTFNNIGLKSGDSAYITLTNVTVSDGNKDIELSDISKIIKVSEKVESSTKAVDAKLSSNNYLKNITINGKEIEFDRENLNYDILVGYDTTKVKIKALTDDKMASVSGTGDFELDEGTNEFEITVVAENGNEKTYVLNIYRESSEYVSTDSNDDVLFIDSSNEEITNFNPLVIIIPILVIIFFLGIFLIFKRKGKK